MGIDQEFRVNLEGIVPEYQSRHWIVRYLFNKRLHIAAQLIDWKGGRVLDAGCGSGLLLKTVAEIIPPTKLYGIDLNENIGKLHVKDGCTIQYADLHHTPFEDGFFETVCCLDVLEHIEDLQSVLAEISRILGVSGSLIVSIPMENLFYKLCRYVLKGTTSMEEGPCAGKHYWEGKSLVAALSSVMDLEEVCSLPLGGPLSLFKIVRLRKRSKQPVRSYNKVSIVIPVFNEKNTIDALVARVLMAPLLNLHREVIIVDDGSTDGTREVLRQITDERVNIFHHQSNHGKGAALRTGFEKVTGDIVIVQDADLEYRPEEYTLLLKPILQGHAEVVYGSRFKGRDHRAHSSFLFFIGGQVVTWVANLLFDLDLTDEPTCYKVFRADILPALKLRCEKFEFCPEFTAKVARRGIPIFEVPISYQPRTAKEGKKIGWRDGVEAITTLIRYRFSD